MERASGGGGRSAGLKVEPGVRLTVFGNVWGAGRGACPGICNCTRSTAMRARVALASVSLVRVLPADVCAMWFWRGLLADWDQGGE